jgi:manganese transport protein
LTLGGNGLGFSISRTISANGIQRRARPALVARTDRSSCARWLAFGPAALVTVGYMDPGNWATDLAAGSGHGYLLLSVVLLLEPDGDAAADPLGAARHRQRRDLATCCREYYPKPVSLTLWVLAELGIVACDLAELIGVAVALHLLFGLPLVAACCSRAPTRS